MQKHAITVCLLATFALAACNNSTPNNATATPAASSTPVAASDVASAETPTNATPASPTLSSKDGKLTITTNGYFADKSSDAVFLPADVKAEDVLLLQYDDSRNLTISAIQSGKAKTNAADLFASLQKALESNKSLQNLNVGQPENDRLRYGYTQAGQNVANESCLVAVDATQNITTVCASSSELSQEELAAILADVKIGA